MSSTRLNPQAQIHAFLAERWSPRAFDDRRPVEVEKLAACLEAARWAPSCYNDQPWRFLVTDRYRNPKPWQQLLDCLAPVNQSWARRAPILLLACAAKRFSHNDQPNRWGAYDTGQAMLALVLQAGALGLVAHQMGGFDAERARQAFAIPASFDPISVTALGYRGDPGLLDDAQRQREEAPRQRRPIQEIAFADLWGQPFEPPPTEWETGNQVK